MSGRLANEVIDVLLEVLDDVELSVRMGDIERLHKVAFVWSQRRDYLLTGRETWDDQRIGRPHAADIAKQLLGDAAGAPTPSTPDEAPSSSQGDQE